MLPSCVPTVLDVVAVPYLVALQELGSQVQQTDRDREKVLTDVFRSLPNHQWTHRDEGKYNFQGKH